MWVCFDDGRRLRGVYQGCGKLTGMVDAKLEGAISMREQSCTGTTYGAV